MHANIEVHDDDTYSGSMIMAYSDDALAQAGMSPSDIDAMLGSQLDSLDGGTAEDYSEDGYTGKKVNFPSQPLSALAGSTGADSMTITREGDTYVMSGSMDLTTAAMGVTEEELQTGGYALDAMDIQFIFTFPGPVESSNGDISGNSVTFRPEFGQINTFEAVASAEPGGFIQGPDPTDEPPIIEESPTVDPSPLIATASAAEDDDKDKKDGIPMWVWIAIGGGVVLIAVVVTIIVLAQKRKKANAAAPTMPAPGGYPGSAPVQGYPMPPSIDTPTQVFGAPEQPTQPFAPQAPAPAQPTQPFAPQPPAPAQPPAPGYPPQAPPYPPAQQPPTAPYPPTEQPPQPPQGYPPQA
jgi:hypothetical protein